MLFREIESVHCESDSKYFTTTCGKIAETYNVTARGAQSNH